MTFYLQEGYVRARTPMISIRTLGNVLKIRAIFEISRPHVSLPNHWSWREIKKRYRTPDAVVRAMVGLHAREWNTPDEQFPLPMFPSKVACRIYADWLEEQGLQNTPDMIREAIADPKRMTRVPGLQGYTADLIVIDDPVI